MEISKKELIAHLKDLRKEASKLNERRVVILATDEDITLYLSDIIEPITKKGDKLLVVTDEDDNGLLLRKFCKKILGAKPLDYTETTEILGTTYDILIMDLRHNLNPDDIGRLVDTVKGGGMIFFITVSMEKFPTHITRFHRKLLISRYSENDLKMYFTNRFYRKLLEHDGISIIEIKDERFYLEKNGLLNKDEEFKRKELILPAFHQISSKIYRMAITQDEIDVIKMLEEFWKEDKKSIFILKANRGRGKSAALGLFLAGVIHQFNKTSKKFSIAVTAPEKTNVDVLFEFLKKGLNKLHIDCKYKDYSLTVSKGRITVEYRKPIRIPEHYYDLVVVDEAAGIPLPMLFRIVKKFYKTVFSSTVHGYEGSGRSFTLRFIEGIKKEKMGRVFEFQMKEPIRYSEDDPIEKWLFDALLLDAEPVEVNENDAKDLLLNKIEYVKPDLEKWFREEEQTLRDFFGIYILAHYRNRPRDISILADSPHHFPRCVMTETDRHIINSVHLCEEGMLTDNEIEKIINREMTPRGNVIPAVLARHYRNKEVGRTLGWRIVRIATHPKLMNMGIGSWVLKQIIKEARENKLDWVGSAFGATPKLLRFWLRNGFIPLHIATERNVTSGEYSVIVLKPLSKRADEMAKIFSYEFRLRAISGLMDVHFDLNVETAYLLLTPFYEHKPHYKLELTEIQKERIKGFLLEHLPYESVSDVCREVAKYYFLDSTKDKPSINEMTEKIIIMKSFLVKSWRKIADYFGYERKKTVINKFRSGMKTMWEYYFE
ncbi:MAG: tRNA(Met) cytidine acetyltransferase [Candidatus Aenigmarchaeota archaeon]|nr:tRNA(Met) cytidine acetyltransferase [Candidatus Aenigmarchaeota archaeon]